MSTPLIRYLFFIVCFMVTSSLNATAQEYVSPTKPTETGKSPGVKVKLLSTNGGTKTYAVIFSPGDEVSSGLTEFAQKYDVKCAHYTAIGDAQSAKVGFYDYDRKMFKVIPVNEPCEVTSLVGDIATLDGKPVAHSHVALAVSDGTVRGGHLLEMVVGPTLEVFVTVEPAVLQKKIDPQYGAGIIDLNLEK